MPWVELSQGQSSISNIMVSGGATGLATTTLTKTAGYRQAAEVIAAGWLPRVISQSIYGVSLKLSVMFRFAIYRDIKRHIPGKQSHIGYCRTDTHCWHHHTITVQGIRNHFSPVTPLVSLNLLKCSGTFLIY